MRPVLKYRGRDHGPSCTCCMVVDAGRIKVDPTGTGSIRRNWRSDLAIKWRRLRVLTRQVILEQDLLTLNAKGLMSPSNPAIQGGATKIQMFQRWFDYIIDAVVLQGDGSHMRKFIAQAYEDGTSYARSRIKQPVIVRYAQDRQDAIYQLAVVELQGIQEAVSQQGVRAVANALIHASRPLPIMRAIYTVIDKIGITRSNTMIELLVVKAFNEAVLDVYEAAGVSSVGLIPEAIVPKVVGDAKRAQGPGSRSRGATPSRSTIGRIRAVQRQLERLNRVNVITAGDNDVCPVCEDIADEGPYSIDTARSLIPAHPHCRCTFEPVDGGLGNEDDDD